MIISPIQTWLQRTLKLLPIGLLVLLSCGALDIVFWPVHSWASDEALGDPPTPPNDPVPASIPATTDITLLPPVTVFAAPEPITGQGHTINGELLKHLPMRKNSINEAISILPGVQLSDEAFLSTQGGEILAPVVSISGGKIYGNNFTIDGMNNNSLLDPSADNPVELFDVPGHPQGLFLDPTLIDQVTVFDSNVPASFGGFTGGAVEATTIMPAPVFSSRLFYRTTRDSWTSFHLDPAEKDNFEQSRDHTQQPEFEKHHAGVELHTPLTHNMRLLTAYAQQYSKIPLTHFDDKRNQHRRQENFFAKYAYEPSSDTALNLSWAYSPYEARYFFKNYRNSDYTLHGGGSQITADYQATVNGHSLHFKAGYNTSENRRSAPKDAKKWKITPSKDWGEAVGTNTSNEGFWGDLDKTQETVELKMDWGVSPLSTGGAHHKLNTGIDYRHIKGAFDRKETSYYYYSSKLDPSVSCEGNAIDCVEGEQYFYNRYVYPKNSSRASVNQVSYYLEDILTFKRLELRPGARVSYNDFMDNVNIAPRLAAAYDLFGNRNSILLAGRNRYYDNILLTYKLREARMPLTGYRETRTVDADHQLNDWQLAAATYSGSKYSRLKTPYADEYVLGLDQALLGGRLTFKYVYKKFEDEFAREVSDYDENGIRYYTLNNNGRSRFRGYQVSWNREWTHHALQINGTYEETTSSNSSYDVTLEEEDLQEEVWYDGEAINTTDLPRTDFNQPWVVNLVYTGRLPHGFIFTGLAKYRSGYRALEDTKEDIELPDGRELPIYDEVNHGGAVVVSCSLTWEQAFYRSQTLGLTLEINNLLNKKVKAGNSDDYEIGRQVWAGLEYHF